MRGAKGTVARQGGGGAGGECAASLEAIGEIILWFTFPSSGGGMKSEGLT